MQLRIVRDERPVQVNGLIGDMIWWLVQHRDEVERKPKGSVEMHFAGDALTCKTFGVFDAVRESDADGR